MTGTARGQNSDREKEPRKRKEPEEGQEPETRQEYETRQERETWADEWEDGEWDDEDDDDWLEPAVGGRFGAAFDQRWDGEEADEPDAWGDLGRPGAGPTVQFLFDVDHARLDCVYTRGLSPLGLPELFLSPPPGSTPADVALAARFAVFLAGGLIQLGYRLIAEPAGPIAPYSAEFYGRTVQFWVAEQQAPGKRLARELGSEVTHVIRIDCSLWHAPLLG